MNLNGKTLLESKSNALKPFPIVDHEFYHDTKTVPNYFWQKELTRIKSEKSFMNKSVCSTKSGKFDGNSKTFYNVKNFSLKI